MAAQSHVMLKVCLLTCKVGGGRYVDEESGEPTSRHVDDSVVTFNICLGVGHFEGKVYRVSDVRVSELSTRR